MKHKLVPFQMRLHGCLQLDNNPWLKLAQIINMLDHSDPIHCIPYQEVAWLQALQRVNLYNFAQFDIVYFQLRQCISGDNFQEHIKS